MITEDRKTAGEGDIVIDPCDAGWLTRIDYDMAIGDQVASSLEDDLLRGLEGGGYERGTKFEVRPGDDTVLVRTLKSVRMSVDRMVSVICEAACQPWGPLVRMPL